MKPNQLGGQTFEAQDMGVVRNTLHQARDMFSKVPPSSARGGYSRPYDSLSTLISGPLGVDYNDLYNATERLRVRAGTGLHDSDPTELVADIWETKVLIGAMRWVVNRPDMIDQNVTSGLQAEAARTLVEQFDGASPRPVIVTQP